MKVGMIGMGKLGLPVALVMDMKGHDVMGYDINPEVMQKERCSYREQGPDGEPTIEPILRKSKLKFGSVKDIVAHSDIIFIAVQTPHIDRFEGITRLPKERVDFNYIFLKRSVEDLADEMEKQKKSIVIVLISTVLPGTVRKHILPLTNKYMKICYNPFFIAMGTTMHDFLNPEFVLFGVWDKDGASIAEEFYKTIHSKPFYKTSIESAELIKVSYNTFIGLKIVFVNTIMEICHKTEGADVDDVTNALKLATDRVISTRYLTAGMGDGGGCHPRDNIALSWLARELGLSFDLFEAIMIAREKQAEWLTNLMMEHDLPRVILGKSFKPQSSLQLGSPARLCQHILEGFGQDVEMYDPYIDPVKPKFKASVFLIGTKYPQFEDFDFPEGSVVIDPWRYIKDKEGVKVIRVGQANYKGANKQEV